MYLTEIDSLIPHHVYKKQVSEAMWAIEKALQLQAKSPPQALLKSPHQTIVQLANR